MAAVRCRVCNVEVSDTKAHSKSRAHLAKLSTTTLTGAIYQNPDGSSLIQGGTIESTTGSSVIRRNTD